MERTPTHLEPRHMLRIDHVMSGIYRLFEFDILFKLGHNGLEDMGAIDYVGGGHEVLDSFYETSWVIFSETK